MNKTTRIGALMLMVSVALMFQQSACVSAETKTGAATQPTEERKSTVAITPGTDAPLFTLPEASGKEVALKDLAGQWVVLYFYPKDDTPGCTTEACEFTSSIADFEGLKAKVLGVSGDSPESHRKFIEKYKLTVTLLSDTHHKVMEQYGAWGRKTPDGKESAGVARSTVVIDPKGKIAYYWPNVTAKGHANEVKAKLQELQAKK